MMETYPILPLCKDLAQFLLSTLHLLLTRILPLIALLVGSLLLHLIRFTSSFLFNTNIQPHSGRDSLHFNQSRRVLQAGTRLADESHEIYEDALQEALIHEGGPSSAMQEEWYEDCQDENIVYHDINDDQQLRWLQGQVNQSGWRLVQDVEPEEVGDGEKQADDGAESRDGGNGEMGDGKFVLLEVGDRYIEDVGGAVQAKMGDTGGATQDQVMGDSLRKVDDGMDDLQDLGIADGEMGDGIFDAQEQRRADGDLGDGVHGLGRADEGMGDGIHAPQELDMGRGRRADEEVGDLQAKPIILSQGNLISFPSDLPPSLDDVIIAAAFNNAADEKRENRDQRPLVPTFSSVAAALQENSANLHADIAGPPATRTSSDEKFMAKFKQHFILDGR